MQKPITIL